MSVNNHQQCRKQPSQDAHSLLGRLGGGLGQGKIYLGRGGLIIFITFICAPQRGRDVMDCIGMGWMT